MAIKILLIDDNPDDLELMQVHLKENGFENIVLADTGEEGVAKAESERPDLVVTDKSLPQMHGFEVCQKIKSINGLRSKVIVQTSMMDTVDANTSRLVGADGYCVKTSDCSDLLELISNFT